MMSRCLSAVEKVRRLIGGASSFPARCVLTQSWADRRLVGHSFPDNSGHARRSFSGGKHNSIPLLWTSPSVETIPLLTESLVKNLMMMKMMVPIPFLPSKSHTAEYQPMTRPGDTLEYVIICASLVVPL